MGNIYDCVIENNVWLLLKEKKSLSVTFKLRWTKFIGGQPSFYHSPFNDGLDVLLFPKSLRCFPRNPLGSSIFMLFFTFINFIILTWIIVKINKNIFLYLKIAKLFLYLKIII